MIEPITAEKQCGRCMKCKPTIDFKFRSMTMTYYDTCRECDAEVKAAKAKPPPEQRLCKACDTLKPLALFPRDPTCSGGHAYKCRLCKNAANAERKAAMKAAGKLPQHRPETATPDDPLIRAAWYLHSPKLPANRDIPLRPALRWAA